MHSSTEHLSLPSHTKDVRCKPKNVAALYHLHMMTARVKFSFNSFCLSFLLLNFSTGYFQGFSEKQQWQNPSDNNWGTAGRSHRHLFGAVVGMVEAGWNLVELQAQSVLMSCCSTGCVSCWLCILPHSYVVTCSKSSMPLTVVTCPAYTFHQTLLPYS